jgi:hypothetical protein
MNHRMRKFVVDRKIVEQLILKKSFNDIERHLKVGKKRIRKIYDLAKSFGYLNGVTLPSYPESIFDPPDAGYPGPVSLIDKALLEQIPWIKEKRSLQWHWVTIFEELPIKVSSSSFYRFIKRHNLNNKKLNLRLVPEIIHAPGESLILDWGKLCDVIEADSGKKRTLWFLAGVMGHSRYMMVRLVWDNKLETTLKAIESMFNEIGGIPKKLTSDNPKCFATEASKFEPILNPGFERFCSHYQVIAELLPPSSPEKKGKVERQIPYVRRLYEAAEEFVSLEDSQKYIDIKVNIANERKHGTTKLRPLDLFLQNEATVLNNLPATSFTPEEYHQGVVRCDGHIRFRGKYYSLHENYIGKEVFIIGTQHTVEIYFSGRLIETHSRLNCVHKSKSTKNHHLKSHEQIVLNNNYYLERAMKIGTHVHEMVVGILSRGNGFVDLRTVWGILNLDKDYSAEKINMASKHALECDQLGYRAVLKFINLGPNEEKLIKKSTGNKFLRDPNEYKQPKLINEEIK